MPTFRFLSTGVCCLLFTVLCAPVLSHAQPSVPASPDTARVPADTVYQLPEVPVEASRLTATSETAPYAVSVLRRSDAAVNLTPNVSLEQTLLSVPGVWVNDRGHFALGERISVRGFGYRSNFGVRNVQVLLDGVPLTLPDGQAFLDVVDPAVVRRAELIRSPASLFWGNGSGGVLFFSTRPPADGPALRTRLQTGSFGRRQGLVEAQTDLGPHRVWGYASGIRQDGYRAHSAGYRLRSAFGGQFVLGPRTDLRVSLAGDVQDAENPSSLTRDEFEADPTQARSSFQQVGASKQSAQGQLGLTLQHDLGLGTLTATAYGLARDLDNPLPFNYVSYVRQSGGLRLTARRQQGRLQGGFGVDAATQRDDRLEYASAQNAMPSGDVTLDQVETVSDAAAFGYLRARLVAQLYATAGLRVDAVRFTADDQLLRDGDQSGRRTLTDWTPSAGLSYDFGPALAFAHYSTAFGTPTTTELVNSPEGGGGFNREIEPQQSQGLEVGARGTWEAARLRFDVALFRQTIQNRIAQVGETPDGRAYFGNQGENTHAGVETALTWAPLLATTGVGLEVMARYVGSRFTLESGSNAGNRVPGIPEHRLYAHVQAEHEGFWGRLQAETVSEYFVNSSNTASTPGYTVVDLRFGHQGLPVVGTDVQPFVAVGNVFDATYNSSVVVNAFNPPGGQARYYEPAPGRHFSVGVNVAL